MAQLGAAVHPGSEGPAGHYPAAKAELRRGQQAGGGAPVVCEVPLTGGRQAVTTAGRSRRTPSTPRADGGLAPVLVSWGCRSSHKPGGSQNQRRVLSQFWMPQVQHQEVSRATLSL